MSGRQALLPIDRYRIIYACKFQTYLHEHIAGDVRLCSDIATDLVIEARSGRCWLHWDKVATFSYSYHSVMSVLSKCKAFTSIRIKYITLESL